MTYFQTKSNIKNHYLDKVPNDWDSDKFNKFKHFDILKNIIENLPETDDNFQSIWLEYQRHNLVSPEFVDKVEHGIDTWADCNEDLFSMFPDNLKIWFYSVLIRMNGDIEKFIPLELFMYVKYGYF